MLLISSQAIPCGIVLKHGEARVLLARGVGADLEADRPVQLPLSCSRAQNVAPIPQMRIERVDHRTSTVLRVHNHLLGAKNDSVPDEVFAGRAA